MKKKLRKKLLQKKSAPKLPVETPPEITRTKKARGKKCRTSFCPKCGIVQARPAGTKPPLCTCGTKMKRGVGLTESEVKNGKINIEQLRTEEAHPDHPERTSRKLAMTKDSSPAQRLTNYKAFISTNKSFTDLSGWWDLVFPGEDYPEDKSWFLISLRIEYKLIADAAIMDGVSLTARQVVNYVAVMELNVEKLTLTLQNLVRSYDEAHQLRLSKEEERLIKANKE